MPSATLAMHYATSSDGVRIAYVSVGDGSPLIFAANIFGDATGYRAGFPHVRQVTDRLAHLGWRVVRYDQRGMGSSDRDVKDFSFAARIRDLEAVVGAVDLDRFALGAVDVGAATDPCAASSVVRYGAGRTRSEAVAGENHLRHSKFVGLCDDKKPTDVRRE